MTLKICPKVDHQKDVFKAAVKIHDEVKSGFESKRGKIIIFCPFTEWCIKIQALVPGSSVYHSRDSLNSKASVLEKFRTAAGGTLCSTTALGAGVDIEDVQAVLIVGTPTSFLDAAQQLGRGGRSGEPFLALVLPCDTKKNWQQRADPMEGIQECGQWVSDGVCRHLGLGKYLDGGDVLDCIKLRVLHHQTQLCDICIIPDVAPTKPRTPVPVPGSSVASCQLLPNPPSRRIHPLTPTLLNTQKTELKRPSDAMAGGDAINRDVKRARMLAGEQRTLLHEIYKLLAEVIQNGWCLCCVGAHNAKPCLESPEGCLPHHFWQKKKRRISRRR
jgi:superfamily II DNA or RNA helicase